MQIFKNIFFDIFRYLEECHNFAKLTENDLKLNIFFLYWNTAGYVNVFLFIIVPAKIHKVIKDEGMF